ncbi:MAG: type IV toxin-antitoxin system AbiEi family antitoxin domain-containing protein [Christensenellaceae bacterium]|jgi:predicted transcriptional regulator of viral defense system|nr:type IV toxin-antitoxin system AbiEi family antitoxin domain-containing protein [Christensenellaceae bacterium]
MKREILDSLLRENNGFLRTSEVVAAGISREYLGEYVRKNGLERVAHGLYISEDAWDDGMYVIQVRYPTAVFSHETALYLLGLAEREPSVFSVTLKANANTMRLRKDGVKVYRVKENLLDEGVTDALSPTGHPLRSYNAERTICDLFRNRSGIDTQDLQAAVKEYIRRGEKNISRLLRCAKKFRVEKILRQYLEVLL